MPYDDSRWLRARVRAPCVAELAFLQDRPPSLRAAVRRETEPLVALTHLLH
jgi:hypothetical protein